VKILGDWTRKKRKRSLFRKFRPKNDGLKLENSIKNMEEKYSVAINFHNFF